MRLATSSIPRETLSRILTTAVPRDDLEGRLQIVRLYLQSDRYRDAGNELDQILKDFPERKDLEQDIRQLRQLAAGLILKEIQLRAEAGQHERVRLFLEQFPSEGVSGETLAEVRERLDKYAAEDARRKSVLGELQAQVGQIADENGRRLAENFAKEITEEANAEGIERLATFERLVDDPAMSPEEKSALAISGWLVGANQATKSFQAAVSLARVRDMVRQYLGEADAQTRSQLASELTDMEDATVERVAQILKLMKPPMPVSKGAERARGMFELPFRGMTGENDGRYLVQLPPEYDPLRHYPAIVALADAGVSTEQMLDFWAGAPAEIPLPPTEGQGEGSGGTTAAATHHPSGERFGQATRHGYIVIAVDWQQPHQLAYDYSDREHHAVLSALRDACRRFAIDTDRVFLTGHGMGGDAAWDIAVAHPDLWAGVIPIVARAGRYVERYAKNAPYLAWYLVAGELDGDKLARNAQELDRYMKPKNDVTVVEYLGRGFEPFGDEIQRLFEWMARRRRTMPTELDCVSMRPWDNFFWWLEAEGLPEKSMVSPPNWPPARGVRPARLRARRLEANKVLVSLQAERVSVWLAPELVDFSQPLVVEVNNRAITPRDRRVEPDLNVLLEDARTRADRQHPFWAKVSTP
jgi:pimeloyl-ACP methyl ester carboxylesterase